MSPENKRPCAVDDDFDPSGAQNYCPQECPGLQTKPLFTIGRFAVLKNWTAECGMAEIRSAQYAEYQELKNTPELQGDNPLQTS